MAACSVNHLPFSDRQRAGRVNKDLDEIFSRQEPIMGALTVYEAMARAIKYNLDHRVKLMEEMLAQGFADLSDYEMLPSIAASGGFSSRSKDSGSSSKSLLTGNESLEPSTSLENQRMTTDLSVAWNVLDFGVSYSTAKQMRDRKYIAKETRRKAIQNIVHDVKSAFWRAVGAQKLKKDLDYLIEDVQSALDDSRMIERRKLKPPVEALDYQKTLLSTMRQLLALRREVSFSKFELAALMNVDPAIEFKLDDRGKNDYTGSDFDLPIRQLEHQALMNRPELRAEDYKYRISVEEVRKEMLRLLPGVELTSSLNHDSNEFLYNKTWAESGLRVTFNLLNLITGNKSIDVAKTKQEIEHYKRLALNVAVLTQVHVGYQRVKQSREEYDIAMSLDEVNERLYRHAVVNEKMTGSSKLKTIQRQADLLFSKLRKDYSYAEWQEAESSLYLSLGLDPIPQVMTTSHVTAIADALEDKLRRWDSGEWQREIIEEGKRKGRYSNGFYSDFEVAEVKDNVPSQSDINPEISKWAVGDWLDDVVNEIDKEDDNEPTKLNKEEMIKKQKARELSERRKARIRKRYDIEKEKYGYGHIPNAVGSSYTDSEDMGKSLKDFEDKYKQSKYEEMEKDYIETKSYKKILDNYQEISSKSVKRAGPSYMQLGAYISLKVAHEDWDSIVKKNSRLSAYEPEYRKARVNGKDLYRLIVSGDKSSLAYICDELKSKSQDCIVR